MSEVVGPKPHAVVVFGAGASFACTNVSPRPPLGNDLYARLSAEPPFSLIDDQAKAAFQDRGFEAGMAAVYESGGSGIVLQLQKQIAAYLLQLMPDGRPTLYDSILAALSHKRVLWSSLNYDGLLESAAESQFGTFNYSPFPKKREANILKLHGSANLASNSPIKVSNIRFGMPRGMGLVGGGIDVLDRQEALARWRDAGESIGPAMSVFVEGKDELVGRDQLELWRSMWAAQLARADSVVCIGTHIHAPDDHIWGVVAKAKGKIGFVSPERDLVAAWASTAGHRRIQHVADYFDEEAIGRVRRFVSTD